MRQNTLKINELNEDVNFTEDSEKNDINTEVFPENFLLKEESAEIEFNEEDDEFPAENVTQRVLDATQLFLSPRTIENKIQEMYEKAGVNNNTDFAEFCEKRHLHRYLPRRFIHAERCSFEQSIDVGSNVIDQ